MIKRIYHGQYNTKEYKVWAEMIQRCENPKNKNFKHYGGRNITVCERWRNSFENFLEDMGKCPKGLTLERKNNNENYCLKNCEWATWGKQANNRRFRSCGSSKQRWFYGHGPNDEMIIENSQHHVAKIFELCQASISQCLRGKCVHRKGWTFQWIPIQQGEKI